MHQPATRIVIVGGGSAGWLTAGVIAAKHHCLTNDLVSVTLVESPNIKTIGVGEGTWPSMRNTLKAMGISEAEFIRHCDVSFKQGSKFVGWKHGQNETYYHPFTKPTGSSKLNLALYWQQYRKKINFADAVCPQSSHCDKGLAPKQITTPEYAFALNYGYHLNAGKFGQFLKNHCTKNLGVRYISAEIESVENDEQDYISALICKNGRSLQGDLFIDCTGFRSVLLGEHYGVKLHSKKHILMNDRAIAAQVPYRDEQASISSFTSSSAKDSGWVWDIGLSHRRGVGYVYSSSHSSEESAEQVLVNHIEKTSEGKFDSSELRRIDINPGYRERFWNKNVVAIGLSAGFLEPLEASALVLVELSAQMIADQLPRNREIMPLIEKRFNQTFTYRWESIIDFLKLHYVLSDRSDSDYWQDMRCSSGVTDSLKELLDVWRYQPPDHHDHLRVDEMFPTASYQYVLYGMGFTTNVFQDAKWRAEKVKAESLFNENRREVEKAIRLLPTNRDLINGIHKNGMSKI